ncbi:hypothetical protein [Rhizobium oryzicola]|uniref:Growth inhibitor PemK n=1 Tax=Rhizobium oryzicola TaxID=1232668 RepID=A0ABT8SUY6_9HYPH|nr:hypothetical protein [Rhizobium oryzicola]MDO1582254.1 hypothetical protein [Rhizobium oryzicola]
MNYPDPVTGLVIRYNYLWDKEKRAGYVEGSKDRPCAIVMHALRDGATIVVPITHSPPDPGEEDLSIEIPLSIGASLGLDDAGSWVRVSEVNRFFWPGIHLRPLPQDPGRVHYGMIPREFFLEIQDRLFAAMQKTRVPKTER